jgi:hypothetical protein
LKIEIKELIGKILKCAKRDILAKTENWVRNQVLLAG